MNKIAIVCNSTNSDLVEYFLTKVNAVQNDAFLRNKYIALKNVKIKLSNDYKFYNSSIMEKAFLDKYVIFDFFKSFYLLFVILFNKVNIVHFTTAHVSNIFLSILIKPFKIKQIFTLHDLVPHPGKKSIFIKLYNNFVIRYLSDEIISFSKSEIEKNVYKNKFKFMHLSGFKINVSTPKIGNKNILFIGRMETYKGFKNLESIIKLSNENNTGYSFTIAGKGTIPNLDELTKLSNVEIINRFIENDEMYDLFEKATFTLLPYDSATQSGVTLLSYSYATPVIAYEVGSLCEYIENSLNGFTIKYKNDESIINILKNLDDDDIKKLSICAIDRFDKFFSEKACRLLYLDYYKEKIGEKK